MEIVADASVFLAVVLNESDRGWVIDRTSGADIVSPEVLPYEIGNALIAMMKRGRLDRKEVLRAFHISQKIAVKLVPIRIPDALRIAGRLDMYPYDAYYLQCCMENRSALISLDDRMCDLAEHLEIKVVR